ncbi:Green fluorescent protein-like protein [Artemisia annua]|uniref:Green fluorescent protein-like protein n=1 Tax=Artemisia annua TaxID=35608 RepID=A0A2U1P5J4_ARTAN|nr:Green fluorescent protein-like protein [Artemisia annua]
MDNLDREELMDMKWLEATGCKVLFSSVTVHLNKDHSESSPVSLEFQSLELGWWVSGECSCAQNAICRNVAFENRTVGYRCQCSEGYTGDGFTAGNGCRRAIVE